MTQPPYLLRPTEHAAAADSPADPSSPPAPTTLVQTVEDLVAHFQRGAKSPDRFRIGIEHEKLGVALHGDGTVRPLPYSDAPERPQILTLLHELARVGWQKIEEHEHLIALKRAGASVTLEPGGQFELSGPPCEDEAAVTADLDAHLRDLLPLGERIHAAFLGCGFRPLGRWEDVPYVPKGRYQVMRAYLPTRGKLGVEMMKRTATVQANLDYHSEPDAIAKLRLGLGLSSLVTAMFAASPLVDGKPSGYQSYRAACWLDTDPDRCGLVPVMFTPEASFRAYAEWALDVPMFFVYRHEAYTPADGMTFRAFMRDGWRGERATLADWDLHISTLFPEARLKQYIEVRGADSGPLEMVHALPGLWRGLFYADAAREAAWALVADFTLQEREQLRRDVPMQGLHAKVRGRDLGELCLELVRIAEAGLRSLGSQEGVRMLQPLLHRVAQRRTPADDILTAFQEVSGDPAAFVEKVRYRSP